MSQTINRMFDSPDSANRAARELESQGFSSFTEVYVFDRYGAAGAGAGRAELSSEEIVASLMRGYVLKAHAKIFAEGIKRGGALVTVHAPFGAAATVVEILDRHRPIDSGVADFKENLPAWDEAAPCSSLLGLRVLLADNATFSRFWNVPALLKRGSTTFSAFGFAETLNTSGSYRGLLGQRLISNKATMLSSMLGLPVLTKPRPGRAHK